LTQLSVD